MMLYNVGDSHTYPAGKWNTELYDQYWQQIANFYGCTDIVNDSIPGRSNDAMIKLVIKHELENPNLPTLYIVNITTIFRIDLHTPESSTLKDVLTTKAIAELDFETIECSLYAHLIGLIEFLKSRNKQFLIINNGKNFSSDQLPMRDAYVEYFQREPRILNWFSNSKVNFHQDTTKIKPVDYDLYSWDGHDGPEGHRAYYEMLVTRLPKLQ
ncbi:hypothetical protein UFOVP112_256 [uncultured Caudovirales phage]|uniref:Uncharacterized protein n=1 Tax=uncultured Caudovirales phage TaxID=2100421 RepID=A0A6J5L386_9CAUD|nr:hypothetical protein UFOVP112_256 [uncultured Caudovirales phage]